MLKYIRNLTLSSLIIAVIVSGCTTKKNPVGDDSNRTPYKIKITENILDYYYSYEDKVRSYYPNNKLIVGKYRSNQSVILIRFGNLPATGFEIEGDAVLTLGIKSRYEADAVLPSLGTTLKNWSQIYANWEKANDTDEWIGGNEFNLADDIAEIDYQYQYADTLISFTIPQDVIQGVIDGWIADEPTSYGLAIYSTYDTDGYLELNNRDQDNGPTLSFKYRLPTRDDNQLSEYTMKAVHNTFINSVKPDENNSYTANEIAVGNLPPLRTVMKLNIPYNIFNVEDEAIRKMVVINKAELVVFKDTLDTKTHFSPSETSIGVLPYNLTTEYASSENEQPALPIQNEHLEFITQTLPATLTTGADSLVINITSIIQSFVSEIKENNAILLTSTVENKDNTHIKFYGTEAANPQKRPYLRIIYTRPTFLE